jgi:hypothetical protein
VSRRGGAWDNLSTTVARLFTAKVAQTVMLLHVLKEQIVRDDLFSFHGVFPLADARGKRAVDGPAVASDNAHFQGGGRENPP